MKEVGHTQYFKVQNAPLISVKEIVILYMRHSRKKDIIL